MAAQWAGCPPERAARLLLAQPPSPEELYALARQTGRTEEDLAYEDLAAGLDILRENLRFLLRSLPHGAKQDLASAAGVVPGTVSAWLKGKAPSRSNQEAIRSYFRLPDRIDLTTDPLFLSPLPSSEHEHREWLRQRIDALDGETLSALFPALQRMLRE